MIVKANYDFMKMQELSCNNLQITVGRQLYIQIHRYYAALLM